MEVGTKNPEPALKLLAFLVNILNVLKKAVREVTYDPMTRMSGLTSIHMNT